MVLYDYLLRLKNFFFPGVCVLCGGSLIGSGEIRCALCEKCRSGIVPDSGEKCNLCGKPLVSEIETCLPCRAGGKRSYDRLWTIFPYTGKYRKLLGAYKFDKTLALAELFSEKTMELLSGEPALKNAVLVAVPPRPGKIKTSGWDQVDYLVRRIDALRKVRVLRCLKRKESKIQKQLGRNERLENLKGRIFCEGTAPKTALLIDDVITTGSTMEVCATALKEAGAEKVYGLCLFYD